MEAPKGVINEPVYSINGKHTNPTVYGMEKQEIIPRHATDAVLARVRVFDRDNPAKSKKMQWLQKKAFPDKSPEQIYELSKQLHENAFSKVKAGGKPDIGAPSEKHPLSFNETKPPEKGLLRDDAVNAIKEGIGKGSEHIDIKHSSEPLPEGVEPIANKSLARIGFYDPATQRVTLYHDMLAGPADARWNAWHELTHRGVDVKYSDAYRKALDKLGRNDTIKKLADAIAEQRGIKDKYTALEEGAAEFSAADAEKDFKHLENLYGVKVNQNPLQGASIRRPLQLVKAIWSKVTGLSHEKALDLVRGIREAGRGGSEGAPSDKSPLFSERPNSKLDKYKALAKERLTSGQYTKKQYYQKLKDLQDKFGNEQPPLKQYVGPHEDLVPKQELEKKKDVLGFIKDVRRWFALSNLLSIPKLFGAVGWRMAGSPVENAIVSGLRIIPYFNKIAKGAGRYSGFNSEAELAAARAGIQGFKDMWKVATGKELDIDKFREFADVMGKSGENEMGKEGKLTRPVMDFWTRLHAAAKTPAKRNEFARSQSMYTQARIAELMKEGKSANEAAEIARSPEEQHAIGVKSYINSQKAILLGNNALHNGIEQLLKNGKDSESLLAKGFAHGAELLMPVRKVPLNLAGEASEHMFGAVNAIRILKKGVENLTQEERDYVLRNLSKQTVGLALAAIALAGFARGGGYYTHDKKDFTDKTHIGDIKTPAGTIPHRLTHAPALEIMQTLGNYAKLKERGKSSSNAAMETGLNFAETNVPIAGLISNFVRAMAGGKYQKDKYIDDMITNLSVPGLLSGVAQPLDELRNPGVTGRKTTNLPERFKAKVPLIREQLPAYRDKEH